jgi:hypothetical protein
MIHGPTCIPADNLQLGGKRGSDLYCVRVNCLPPGIKAAVDNRVW